MLHPNLSPSVRTSGVTLRSVTSLRGLLLGDKLRTEEGDALGMPLGDSDGMSEDLTVVKREAVGDEATSGVSGLK